MLDEATSHLDVANEHRVNALVQQLHITRIVLAHRLETLAATDRVVELRPESKIRQPFEKCCNSRGFRH
ncbi:ABC transporter permease and ATP-binding protein, partial [mine drainage metagenome]